MSYFHQDSVFWVEVDKIYPNPYQPRKEFNEEELQSLANSIRQYGVLQALVVTRKEVPKNDGGLSVEYELISGERRLRASKIAGVKEVPVLIREGEESDLMKLELAIIENIQREDLNVVERARAFQKLVDEFSFSKAQVARKVGKSREYVSNTMRVLSLPEDLLNALSIGKISEGHARPLMMLVDHPQEQQTLFKEIMYKKISVREAERVAKKVAKERVRKPTGIDPEIEALEKEFTDSLGTRVNIETREVGGKISIDYFSDDDLRSLLEVLKAYKKQGNAPMLENFIAESEMNEKMSLNDEVGEGMQEREKTSSEDSDEMTEGPARQENEEDVENEPGGMAYSSIEMQKKEETSSISPPPLQTVTSGSVSTESSAESSEQDHSDPNAEEDFSENDNFHSKDVIPSESTENNTDPEEYRARREERAFEDEKLESDNSRPKDVDPSESTEDDTDREVNLNLKEGEYADTSSQSPGPSQEEKAPVQNIQKEGDNKKEEEDLYSVRNFTI